MTIDAGSAYRHKSNSVMTYGTSTAAGAIICNGSYLYYDYCDLINMEV